MVPAGSHLIQIIWLVVSVWQNSKFWVMVLRFLCVYAFVTAASLTLRNKGYKGNNPVKYWDFGGCWRSLMLCSNRSTNCFTKKSIHVGDLTPMIPVNPGTSWKNTKRYTKARYACSILRLLDLAFWWKNEICRRDFSNSYGHSFI